MDVHLKIKYIYIGSKGQPWDSHSLFGYKIKHVFIQEGIMAIIKI